MASLRTSLVGLLLFARLGFGEPSIQPPPPPPAPAPAPAPVLPPSGGVTIGGVASTAWKYLKIVGAAYRIGTIAGSTYSTYQCIRNVENGGLDYMYNYFLQYAPGFCWSGMSAEPGCFEEVIPIEMIRTVMDHVCRCVGRTAIIEVLPPPPLGWLLPLRSCEDQAMQELNQLAQWGANECCGLPQLDPNDTSLDPGDTP